MNKTLVIKGMACQHCVNRVKKGLETIEGLKVQIDLERGTAQVSHPSDITDEQLRQAIEDAGYEVVEIR